MYSMQMLTISTQTAFLTYNVQGYRLNAKYIHYSKHKGGSCVDQHITGHFQDVTESMAVGLLSSCSNTILSRPESELSHERRRPVVDTEEEEA